MFKNKYSALWLISIISVAWGCPSPTNIQGIAFTNNETVNFSLIESLGEQGTHFFREGEYPNVEYRYISHYSPKAMVYVGNFGLSYMEDLRLNCMGVILAPSEIPGNIDDYGTIDQDLFDFNQAVMTELTWLVRNNIIVLSPEEIEKIEDALSRASNGGVQYWTMQEDILGYNSWYEYDEVTGTWLNVGVKGVRGVYEVDGSCSIVSVEFAMPTEQIEGAEPIIHYGQHLVYREQGFRWVDHQAEASAVFFEQPTTSYGFISIMNISGVIVAHTPVGPGTRKVKLRNMNLKELGCGWYYARYISDSNNLQCRFLVVR